MTRALGRSTGAAVGFVGLVAVVVAGCAGTDAGQTSGAVETTSETEGGTGGEATEQTAELSGEPVNVGLLPPITGAAAEIADWQRGWEPVMEQYVNESGGIGGRPLDIIVYDTELDPATAATMARRLVERDGVVAISCCLSSSEALQVATVGAELGVPIVGGATVADLLNEEEPWYGYYFMASPGGDVPMEFNVNFAAEQEWETVAISHSSLTYGTGGAETLTTYLADAGIEVVEKTPVAPDATELTGPATTIASASPDGVLLWDYPGPTAVMPRDLRNVGYNGPIVSNWSAFNESFWTIAGTSVQDMYAHTAFDETKPHAMELMDRYEEVHGKRPEGQQPVMESHYLDVIINALRKAVDAGGELTGESVRQALLELDIPTDELTLGAAGTQLTFGQEYVSAGGQNPYQGTNVDWMMMRKAQDGEWVPVD